MTSNDILTGTWHQLCSEMCPYLWWVIISILFSTKWWLPSIVLLFYFECKKTSKTLNLVCPLHVTVAQDFCSDFFFTTLVTALIWAAMPSTPVLGPPECSSRECIIKVAQSVMTQHLEIQHRAEAETWTSYPDAVRNLNCSEWSRFSMRWCKRYFRRLLKTVEDIQPLKGLLIQSQR